jgi:hypothetical protein
VPGTDELFFQLVEGKGVIEHTATGGSVEVTTTEIRCAGVSIALTAVQGKSDLS